VVSHNPEDYIPEQVWGADHADQLHRSDLTVPQREAYISAVLCLQKLPPRAPKDKFPGALSRFDDFVAFHMTEAMMLHDPVRTGGTTRSSTVGISG